MTAPPALVEALDRSQGLGFLGPGPLGAHVDHALGFAVALGSTPATFLDLGSGGGLPGLVLAVMAWPEASGVLVDAAERRCAFLSEAVAELGLDGRLRVVRARAEEAGRDPSLRSSFDVVVARSFGAPAVTAECAAPFLHQGGTLVVSEPPPAPTSSTAAPAAPADPPPPPPSADSPAAARWPADALAPLGLVPGLRHQARFGYQLLHQATPCPDRYPRRVGIPTKRPLF